MSPQKRAKVDNKFGLADAHACERAHIYKYTNIHIHLHISIHAEQRVCMVNDGQVLLVPIVGVAVTFF